MQDGTSVPGAAAEDSTCLVHLQVTPGLPGLSSVRRTETHRSHIPGGTQCAHTGLHAHPLTARTAPPLVPLPFTPSKVGACSVTG